MPRFLDTCDGNARKKVTNHGVDLVSGEAALIGKVVAMAEKHFRKVPVLVIASSRDQLAKLHAALQACG